MARRLLLPALLLIAIAAPLTAADLRGDLYFGTHSTIPMSSGTYYDLWQYSAGWPNAYAAGGTILLYKPVPYAGAGHFLEPAPNEWIFHSERTVSHWDGVYHVFTEPGKGYDDLFTDDVDLGDIAPLRSGNFLVAERAADPARGAKLVEFNVHGRVADHRFPERIVDGRALGAQHIEVLSDQCTVLYTTGADDPKGNAVHRLNICTGQPMTDFATLIAGQYAGAVRALPNGHVLVADGDAVFELDAAGSMLRTYLLAGVTHIALSNDGTTFWAGAVHDGVASLVHFDPAAVDRNPRSIPIGNPGMQTLEIPQDVSDLVVVGEWRASSPVSRVRSVRRR